MEHIEATTKHLDEAIRGNGKEGLNAQVARMGDEMKVVKTDLKEILSRMDDFGEHILKMNTAKIQAITRDQMASSACRAVIAEEIEKANGKPGSWQEFRKTWLFPIIMMVVSTIVGAGLTYIVVSAP